MPKVMNTRKQRAIEAFKTAARGPSIHLTAEQEKSYRLWASTWILPRMVDLIPELKGFEYRYACSGLQPWEDENGSR